MSHNVKLIRCIISEKKQSTDSVCCILGACSSSYGADLMTSTHKATAKWISSLQAHAHTQVNQYLYISHCVHANKQLHTLTLKKQQPWPLSRGTQADKRFPRGTGWLIQGSRGIVGILSHPPQMLKLEHVQLVLLFHSFAAEVWQACVQ